MYNFFENADRVRLINSSERAQKDGDIKRGFRQWVFNNIGAEKLGVTSIAGFRALQRFDSAFDLLLLRVQPQNGGGLWKMLERKATIPTANVEDALAVAIDMVEHGVAFGITEGVELFNRLDHNERCFRQLVILYVLKYYAVQHTV